MKKGIIKKSVFSLMVCANIQNIYSGTCIDCKRLKSKDIKNINNELEKYYKENEDNIGYNSIEVKDEDNNIIVKDISLEIIDNPITIYNNTNNREMEKNKKDNESTIKIEFNNDGLTINNYIVSKPIKIKGSVNKKFENSTKFFTIDKNIFDLFNKVTKVEIKGDKLSDKYVLFAVKIMNKNEYYIGYCDDGNSKYISDEKNTYIIDEPYDLFNKTTQNEEIIMISNGKNLKNCHNMFSVNNSLKNIIFLKSFNTENVTNMRGMFEGCSSLTNLI